MEDDALGPGARIRVSEHSALDGAPPAHTRRLGGVSSVEPEPSVDTLGNQGRDTQQQRAA